MKFGPIAIAALTTLAGATQSSPQQQQQHAENGPDHFTGCQPSHHHHSAGGGTYHANGGSQQPSHHGHGKGDCPKMKGTHRADLDRDDFQVVKLVPVPPEGDQKESQPPNHGHSWGQSNHGQKSGKSGNKKHPQSKNGGCSHPHDPHRKPCPKKSEHHSTPPKKHGHHPKPPSQQPQHQHGCQPPCKANNHHHHHHHHHGPPPSNQWDCGGNSQPGCKADTCVPGTYACTGNEQTGVPGWKVCNAEGRFQYGGDCPPHTVCKFYEPSKSPYCVPWDFRL